MTYAAQKLVVGRRPIVALELDLDTCANTYGVAPCTASGSSGSECYNTYKTCQDPANYSRTTQTMRFFPPRSDLPIGIDGFPCMVGEPSIAPTRITPNKGLGWRGAISIKLQDFPHHDRGMDPYISTRSYDPGSQGTFFGKLKARNPYYKGRLMRLRVGYLTDTFSWDNFESRVYVIDAIDGPDSKGTVTIKGKDILALADDKRAQAPAPSSGTLSAAYTAGVSTTLVLQTGEGADYDTDPYTGSAISGSVPGYVRIGDNVLKYTGVSTDTLTGVVGGQFGSTDDDAAIDDGVQQCLYYNAVNVVDIIDDLLKTYAGLAEAYIPYDAGRTTPTGTDDEWDDEKTNWLSTNTLTHIITKPTGINELLGAVIEQNMLLLWWNEIDQEVKLKAIAPNLKNAAPPTLTDDSHLLADSIAIKDEPAERISQVWVHYNKIDITGDDKPENYASLHIQSDGDTEGANAYDEKSVRVIYADWIDTQGLVVTLAGRLLNRLRHTPRQMKFSLDARDTSIWTGAFAVMNTRMFQGITGANEPQSVQVLEAMEREPGHRYDYVAQANIYIGKRYAFIAPAGTPNYGSASAAEKEAYGFASDGTDWSPGEPQYLTT
jgi:hypothetical protein